jgi:hypothetical protein
LLPLSAACLSIACGYDTVENRYATLSEAVEHGAITHGWIPEFLPESSTSIIERHDLDTNEIWLSFDLPAAEHLFLRDVCPATDAVVGPRSVPSWWPESLSAEGEIPNTMFVGRCDIPITVGGVTRRRTGFIAVDADASRAWYWE